MVIIAISGTAHHKVKQVWLDKQSGCQNGRQFLTTKTFEVKINEAQAQVKQTNRNIDFWMSLKIDISGYKLQKLTKQK